MTAMEKVAWTEIVFSLVTVLVAVALYPWIGDAAAAAFALLALVAGAQWYLRPRGQAVVFDERDRAIDYRAIRLGITAAWIVNLFALIALVMWARWYSDGAVSARLLNWLIYTQGAVAMGVKGLVGVIAYRRQSHAA